MTRYHPPTSAYSPSRVFTYNYQVSLRWVFTAGFYKCLEELRKIFDTADADGSGAVDREEFAAALSEKVLQPLLDASNGAIVSLQ